MRRYAYPRVEFVVRRSFFLTVLAAAAGSVCYCRASRAAAGVPDLTVPLRVRVFAGNDVTRLEVAGVVLDALSRRLTTGSGSRTLGSEVVELTGNPYLDVAAATTAGTTIERRYPGTLLVQLRDNSFTVINQVDVETYVASVMSAEVSPGWAPESLRAQAITVRTYAAHARLSRGTREFDVNDDTSSQVYRGIASAVQSFLGAAQGTAGQIVVFRDAPAAVFYGSSCGGHTAAAIELTGQTSPQYLNGVSDLDASGRAYCSAAPYFRWKNSVAAASLTRIVDIPADQLSAITVAERWPDGRVKTISAATSGAAVTMSGREFYSRALGILGYKVIPSTLFDITRDGQNFAFVGHGVGHGVGMCQWGARGRADAGMTAAQILAAYFPGTSISRA